LNNQNRRLAADKGSATANTAKNIEAYSSSGKSATAIEPARRIALIDDNAAILDSLSMLFRSVGIDVTTFQEPNVFLRSTLDNVGCILLDVRLPEMGGMQIFRELKERGVKTPVIFLTGHGDIPMAVRAMQDGAFDFLEKPFDDQALIESVLAALRRDAELRQKQTAESQNSARLSRLTRREREIAELVVEGMTSREIADKLELSLRTIEHYRVKIAHKLEIHSVTGLVRILTP
jgi:FixJ family two-component response regulator